ncbi:uncharacterized protein BDR25DRAFT_249394 [Lindgomyces ingoldianus]|uniref:Uncharacterized protein n=1 Tax=Lindgomyces ingoldianus TaxID=673940 RepID=A0ACB6REF6_9PLEO|nr:uncharacterized protein BDR25DRAFT_249394 [Lindgomyces ingoldianus]KAF2477435.1 hypothetical protein BDR25DRAFT_249394 [Lindgomyces ingoldianus]
MYAPVVVEIVTYFYPVGNTSAVHLTRNLPIEEPADILLLGCGDIRSILFTFYNDQDLIRRTDVTCCDIEAATIARNILLLSLILDDEYGALNSQLSQASKLYYLATSLKSWHDGKYGGRLRFCDSSTMKRVREVWNTYRVPEFNSNRYKRWIQHADSAIQRAMKSRKARMGESTISLSGIRSAAPAGIKAITDAPTLGQHFWDHGTTEERLIGVSKADHINPMFVTDSSTLHYGTDPLLGFHLATAYSPLHKESPLHSESMRKKNLPFKVVEAARVQFAAWAKAFRQSSAQDTTLRFFVGDVISFSYALQHANTTRIKPANIYRDSYHWDPIVLNGSDYAEAGAAPLQFNVIDTSNLIDHVGSLNLLVAVAPLLSNNSSSSLYTESMVQREGSQQEYINSIMCGHFPTISTLMGLFPVEYWANSSPYSFVDDLLLESNYGTADDSSQLRPMHIKLTWRRTAAGPTSPALDTQVRLHLDKLGLARILHKVYLNMFRHENVQFLLSNLSPWSLSNYFMPRFHRGSFALILRFVRSRVETDWDGMMGHLLDLIETETTVLMGLNYIQELYLYLKLYGVLSVPTLSSSPMQSNSPGATSGSLRYWKNIPPILCATLIVPREKIKVITNVDATEIGSPIMHCVIQSSPSYQSQRWQNIFSVVQVSFGNLSTTGIRNTDSFQVSIIEDELRWRGSSALIVSFLVPTWILLLEPQAAKISFGIQSTPAAAQTFLRTLGPEMTIFETTLENESSLFFSQFPPNQKDTSSLLPFPSREHEVSTIEKAIVKSKITANIDSTTTKMTSLACRLQILSEDIQKALQSGGLVQTTQTSPCGFLEIFGPKSIPVAFQFPSPVVRMNSKTRIARKSLYIEVEAPLAEATVWKTFPAHLYPVILASSAPVAWNCSRLNLDRLPTIDTSKLAEIEWLVTHASGMFNTRERQLKTQPTATNAEHDVRFAFRDSLFSLFMIFTGLQGRKSNMTTLHNPTGGGVHAIILISSLKLDLNNRTVVLDCAVLSLTDRLMPRLGPFLGAFSGQKVCHIKVDADELQLWKQNLPAMVERCRSWPHQARCEYRAQSRIPLSTENGQPVICSCGSGKVPANFIIGVPHWESVSRYFVRAAISLCFSTAFSEQLFDLSIFREKVHSMPE